MKKILIAIGLCLFTNGLGVENVIATTMPRGGFDGRCKRDVNDQTAARCCLFKGNQLMMLTPQQTLVPAPGGVDYTVRLEYSQYPTNEKAREHCIALATSHHAYWGMWAIKAGGADWWM